MIKKWMKEMKNDVKESEEYEIVLIGICDRKERSGN